MPAPLIESSNQYRELCGRIAALESHLAAIDAARAIADANATAGRITAEDQRDLLPLDDARADITHTLRGLVQAAGDWETRRARRSRARRHWL